MNILITGGAGFIGSHLVDALVTQHNVIVIDNLSSEVHEQFYFNPAATYHKVDITDYNQCRQCFDNIDVVFHLAARSRIQPSVINPWDTIKNNVLGTANVLEYSREAKVKLLVFSSSSSVYGNINSVPLEEHMPADCLNPYSNSKYIGEQLCAMYSKLYNLSTVSLRYFNVYGPREPLKGPYATVVGKFLRQKENNQPLTIVGNGSQRRDFTHVSDIVNAMISLIDCDCDFNGGVLNVGTGKNYSIKELADTISTEQIYVASRPAESNETLANTSQIKNISGWSHNINIFDYVNQQLNAQIDQ